MGRWPIQAALWLEWGISTAKFHLLLWRHPEGPRLYQRAEGSPVQPFLAGDPKCRPPKSSASSRFWEGHEFHSCR
jgi:hypothetical protein